MNPFERLVESVCREVEDNHRANAQSEREIQLAKLQATHHDGKELARRWLAALPWWTGFLGDRFRWKVVDRAINSAAYLTQLATSLYQQGCERINQEHPCQCDQCTERRRAEQQGRR